MNIFKKSQTKQSKPDTLKNLALTRLWLVRHVDKCQQTQTTVM